MMFAGTSFPSLNNINTRLGREFDRSAVFWAEPSSLPKNVKARTARITVPGCRPAVEERCRMKFNCRPAWVSGLWFQANPGAGKGIAKNPLKMKM
jgi:hypothetical protein